MERESAWPSSVSEKGKPVLVLSSVDIMDEAQVPMALSSADPPETHVESDVNGDVGPSTAVVSNSEIMSKLMTMMN